MRFLFLDHSEIAHWLPLLFDLLYENMQSIAPFSLPYGQAKEVWLREVSSGLDQPARKIILCLRDEELVGYIQYYVRGKMLMVEELQIIKEFQRTVLLFQLCRFLYSVLPRDLQTIEAYADKRNLESLCLMERLGMRDCEDEKAGPFVHMRGPAQLLYERFGRA